MRIKRIAAVLSLCTLAACVAKGTLSFRHFHIVERDFPQVQLGQSSDSVIRLLGRPNYHSGACLQDLDSSPDCVTELVYSYPFAPYIPEYYVVDFSSENRVISANHLISP
jgi:hypothetical protein